MKELRGFMALIWSQIAKRVRLVKVLGSHLGAQKLVKNGRRMFSLIKDKLKTH